MLNPLGPISLSAMAAGVTTGVRGAAAGFSSLLEEVTGGAQRAESPVSASDLKDQIGKHFQKLLKSLGLSGGEPLGLEIDSTGDVWVQGISPYRGEIEAAVAADAELRSMLCQWAVANDRGTGSSVFRWPVDVDEPPGAG